MDKPCSVCKIVKNEREFSANPRSKDGLRYQCKACCYKTSEKWRNANLKEFNATRRRRYAANPEKYIAAAKKDYAANVGRARAAALRRNYGLSTKDVERMHADQLGNCAICLDPLLRANVDHCHETGKVRGLLCTPCNLALGGFRDSKELLNRAIVYLEK